MHSYKKFIFRITDIQKLFNNILKLIYSESIRLFENVFKTDNKTKGWRQAKG